MKTLTRYIGIEVLGAILLIFVALVMLFAFFDLIHELSDEYFALLLDELIESDAVLVINEILLKSLDRSESWDNWGSRCCN